MNREPAVGASDSVAPGFIVPWALYDFGNSLLVINGGLYFPQWLVLDRGISDFWWNAGLTVTGLLTLILAPIVGARSDAAGGRWRALAALTAGMLLSAIALAVVTTRTSSGTVWSFVALGLFVAINTFFMLSLVVYNAMFADRVPPAHLRRVSGAGLAAGWIGAIVGIAAVAPFVSGPLAYLQSAGRANAFLPATVIAAAVLIVALYLLRRGEMKRKHISSIELQPSATLRVELARAWASPLLVAFFAYYFLVADSFGTIQQNMPIYLDRVQSLADAQKSVLLASVLVWMAIGAVGSAWLGKSRPIGQVLGIWVLAAGLSIATFASTSSFGSALAAGAAVGLTMGGVQALTRAFSVSLIPATARGSHFGFYAVLDRASALLGPLLWATVLALPISTITARSRLALTVLGLLVLASLIPLQRATKRKS